MKNFIKIFIFSATTIFLISCEKFIPDPIDPRLSRYTEDGRNISSALINDKVWIAKGKAYWMWRLGYDYEHYFTYQPKNDTLFLDFKAHNSDSNIKFVFVGYGITSVKELNLLRDKKIPINGESFYAVYGGNKANNGQIHFKNVTNNDSTAVLSGTFGFTIADPPTKVSYGRFDFRVSDGINFRIKEDYSPILK